MVCKDQLYLPRTIELLGSNDSGANWTRLDLQAKPSISSVATLTIRIVFTKTVASTVLVSSCELKAARQFAE